MYGLSSMLLLANVANTNDAKPPEKSLNPWHMGTYLRVLSNEYQHDSV